MLYWGREGEGLQVSPRPTVNINPVLDQLVFKARKALHSLDPSSCQGFWTRGCIALECRQSS